MFPRGINVLSLFSRIGSAEVALYRLDIPLKVDVQELNVDQLEQLMSRFDGFDLVVGSIPYTSLDPTLPKPWKGLVDGKNGYLYFWNPVTNVTQYERPISVESVPMSYYVPISSQIQVQQYSEGHNGHNPDKENDRHRRGNNVVSRLEPVSRYNQSAGGGLVHSHNTPNETYGSVIGGSARGHGLVDEESNFSGDAYRHQYEISVPFK
ncbi:hypothetical protein F3Y22_tig00111848pilonHSYRG00085 [Hibiscus syriacus]|uniref:WW domain-containing protein n=1 Tax=Hibiscus syriacus TaxID=106335 RepID=A0A6A2YFF3_HIBSY|nr:hypothetical protein F3Y22_tig00111848pilonHSYRG00085 [Hibiscus syriacus]